MIVRPDKSLHEQQLHCIGAMPLSSQLCVDSVILLGLGALFGYSTSHSSSQKSMAACAVSFPKYSRKSALPFSVLDACARSGSEGKRSLRTFVSRSDKGCKGAVTVV